MSVAEERNERKKETLQKNKESDGTALAISAPDYELASKALCERLNLEARGDVGKIVAQLAKEIEDPHRLNSSYRVLSVMGQFATTEGWTKFKEYLRTLRAKGYSFYVPSAPSVMASFKYLAHSKEILGKPLSSAPNRGFVYDIDKIDEKTVLVYDDTIRRILSEPRSPFEMAVRAAGCPIVIPLGIEGQFSLFSPRSGSKDISRMASVADTMYREYRASLLDDGSQTIEQFTRNRMLESLNLRKLHNLFGKENVVVFEPFFQNGDLRSPQERFTEVMSGGPIGFSDSRKFYTYLMNQLEGSADEKLPIAIQYLEECSRVFSMPELGEIGRTMLDKLGCILRDLQRNGEDPERCWDNAIFVVPEAERSSGLITWGLRQVVPDIITVDRCKTLRQLYENPEVMEGKTLIFLDDLSLSGDQLGAVYALLRRARNWSVNDAECGLEFKGNVIMAPLVSTYHARDTVFRPLRKNDREILFAPGIRVRGATESQFYRSLDRLGRFVFSQLGELGYQNLGLCLQTTFHTPNNCSRFWGKNFAQHFVFDGAKITKIPRPKSYHQAARDFMAKRNQELKEGTI